MFLKNKAHKISKRKNLFIAQLIFYIMEFEFDEPWDYFNSSIVKDFGSNFPEDFFTNPATDLKPQSEKVLEDIISTSISDAGLELGIMKPARARLSCPECQSKVKSFQYNCQEAVYMCENVKVR